MKVVLLMTDSTRFDMLGCVNPDIRTPHLDRLAGEGARFTRAYTTQPVCGPARSAIFTGLFPHANGSWGNSMPLGADVKTLGQRLRDGGVRTAYIGKWHLAGGDYFGPGRCPDGWDPAYWYELRNYLEELTPEERRRSRLPETSFTGIDAAFTYGHRCADRAIRFLDNHAAENFFLCVSFDEPHHPFLCPEPYASMYQNYEMPKSPAVYDTLAGKPLSQKLWAGGAEREDKTNKRVRPGLFYGSQSFIDREIGRVLAAIDAVAPDALVIYTSDHGELLHAHSLWGKGPAVYDENARVPFLARWPGVIPAGAVGDGLVSHIDLCPTIMDAFGLPVPPTLQGQSMVPMLRAPASRLNDRVFVTFNRFEVNHDGCGGLQLMRATITERYKLAIHLLDPIDELYDTAVDPYDLNNLIDDPALAEVKAELHDSILTFMDRTRDPFRGYQWTDRPWRRPNPRRLSWLAGGCTRHRENETDEPRQLDYGTGAELTEKVWRMR